MGQNLYSVLYFGTPAIYVGNLLNYNPNTGLDELECELPHGVDIGFAGRYDCIYLYALESEVEAVGGSGMVPVGHVRFVGKWYQLIRTASKALSEMLEEPITPDEIGWHFAGRIG